MVESIYTTPGIHHGREAYTPPRVYHRVYLGRQATPRVYHRVYIGRLGGSREPLISVIPGYEAPESLSTLLFPVIRLPRASRDGYSMLEGSREPLETVIPVKRLPGASRDRKDS